MTTGGYEWSLSEDAHSWTNCLTLIGEPFDDGRYRQISYKATTPDCKDHLVRMQNNVPDGETVVTQAYTFAVWPDREPDVANFNVISLDTMPLPEVTVEAGSTFLVMTKEYDYVPNGFAW